MAKRLNKNRVRSITIPSRENKEANATITKAPDTAVKQHPKLEFKQMVATSHHKIK